MICYKQWIKCTPCAVRIHCTICDKHDVWDEPRNIMSGYMEGFCRKSWLIQYTVSVLQAMQKSPTAATLERVDNSARPWARKVAESCQDCLQNCADCGGLDEIFEHHVKYEVLGEIHFHLGTVSVHRVCCKWQ